MHELYRGLRPWARRMMRLQLLGSFAYFEGIKRVPLSLSSARVIALVAINRRILRRTSLANTLWPDVTERRAGANLRCSLSRLHHLSRGILDISARDLSLAPEVSVDLHDGRDLAWRTLPADHDGTWWSEHSLTCDGALALLGGDLLPGWYEEWAISAAREWDELRLRALEALAQGLTLKGRFGEAAMAAHAAIHLDPLRESAHAALIHLHLVEGNQSKALSAFREFAAVLHKELGIRPTRQLYDLLAKGGADDGTVRPGDRR